MNITQKKGDITDIVFFVIIMFILSVGIFILAFIIPQITEGLKIGGLNSTSEGAAAISQLESLGTVGLQRGLTFVFMGLIMANLLSAFFIRTHPVFVFMYIMSLLIGSLLSVYLANAYDLIRSTPILASTLASQTLINAIMENILPITIIVGVLSIIIVFAKFSSFGGGGEVL